MIYTAGSSYAAATGIWAPLLIALNAGTGAIIWKTQIMNGCCNGGTTPIAVAEGLVVQGWSRHLLAWDAATGIQRWIMPLWRAAPRPS